MATSTPSTQAARKATPPAAPKRSPRKTSAAKKATASKRPAPKAATAPLKAATAPLQTKASTRALAPAKTAQAVNKPAKAEKAKKPKLIRDSFTIPKPEYVVLDALKERAGKLARSAKKSELLRAGIKALEAMSDAAFLAALTAVPTIKTGRPAATT